MSKHTKVRYKQEQKRVLHAKKYATGVQFPAPTPQGNAWDTVGAGISGAATGGQVGSAFGPMGTAIGAGVGLVGGVASNLAKQNDIAEGNKNIAAQQEAYKKYGNKATDPKLQMMQAKSGLNIKASKNRYALGSANLTPEEMVEKADLQTEMRAANEAGPVKVGLDLDKFNNTGSHPKGRKGFKMKDMLQKYAKGGTTNFEKRINKPDKFIDNGDNTTSTHEMMSFESGGKYYAAPTIIENDKGELKRLSEDAAFNHAMQTGEHKEFATEAEAKTYAKGGYKKGSPLSGFEYEGTRKDGPLANKYAKGGNTEEGVIEIEGKNGTGEIHTDKNYNLKSVGTNPHTNGGDKVEAKTGDVVFPTQGKPEKYKKMMNLINRYKNGSRSAYLVLEKERSKLPSDSLEQKAKGDSGVGRPAKGMSLPEGLAPEDIKGFQEFVKTKLPKYGVDNIYGQETEKQWNEMGKDYLKSKSTQGAQTEAEAETPSTDNFNFETDAKRKVQIPEVDAKTVEETAKETETAEPAKSVGTTGNDNYVGDGSVPTYNPKTHPVGSVVAGAEAGAQGGIEEGAKFKQPNKYGQALRGLGKSSNVLYNYAQSLTSPEEATAVPLNLERYKYQDLSEPLRQAATANRNTQRSDINATFGSRGQKLSYLTQADAGYLRDRESIDANEVGKKLNVQNENVGLSNQEAQHNAGEALRIQNTMRQARAAGRLYAGTATQEATQRADIAEQTDYMKSRDAKLDASDAALRKILASRNYKLSDEGEIDLTKGYEYDKAKKKTTTKKEEDSTTYEKGSSHIAIQRDKKVRSILDKLIEGKRTPFSEAISTEFKPNQLREDITKLPKLALGSKSMKFNKYITKG